MKKVHTRAIFCLNKKVSPHQVFARTQIVIALLSLFYDKMRKLHVGWQQRDQKMSQHVEIVIGAKVCVRGSKLWTLKWKLIVDEAKVLVGKK